MPTYYTEIYGVKLRTGWRIRSTFDRIRIQQIGILKTRSGDYV